MHNNSSVCIYLVKVVLHFVEFANILEVNIYMYVQKYVKKCKCKFFTHRAPRSLQSLVLKGEGKTGVPREKRLGVEY